MKLFTKMASAMMLMLCISIFQNVKAQGCVAIRSGCGANVGGGALLQKGTWLAGTNFRYFHSFRHFRGKHEETERVENGTEVINDSYFTDFLVSYGVSDRLSVNFTLPFVYHHRSSMYEHGGNPRADDPDTPENEFRAGDRHSTSSFGLADIRFGASYWLLDPANSPGTNFALGIGFKLPTGNYRYEDKFYNIGENGEPIVSGVDQSIQPGDGGFGYTLEFQGYHALTDMLMVTGNVYYLINPREQYSLEARGREREYSVPDQFASRLGAFYMTSLHGLNLYGGARFEAVPSSDLVGGDAGFRRPGYVVSLEPGLSYSIRRFNANLTVPIAVERARPQSYSDKQRTKETGVFRNGDAAFADYLINVSVFWTFGKSLIQIDSGSEPINLN